MTMMRPGISTDIQCPVCGEAIVAFITTSKKGRHAIGLKCPRDGRDFRAYINTRSYVEPMLVRIAERAGLSWPQADPETPSKKPERGGTGSTVGGIARGR